MIHSRTGCLRTVHNCCNSTVEKSVSRCLISITPLDHAVDILIQSFGQCLFFLDCFLDGFLVAAGAW